MNNFLKMLPHLNIILTHSWRFYRLQIKYSSLKKSSYFFVETLTWNLSCYLRRYFRLTFEKKGKWVFFKLRIIELLFAFKSYSKPMIYGALNKKSRFISFLGIFLLWFFFKIYFQFQVFLLWFGVQSRYFQNNCNSIVFIRWEIW